MCRTYAFYRLARTLGLALCLAAGWSSASWALEKVHVVQRGESLAAIARQYDVSISQLAAHNGIDNRDYIFVGQRLVMPFGDAPTDALLGTYTVMEQDSLASIAAAYGVSTAELMAYNGLTPATPIWVGQPLLVPIASAESDARYHEVRLGETLFAIARRYGVSWPELATYNNLDQADALATDQVLAIPPATAASALSSAPPARPAAAPSSPSPSAVASSAQHAVSLGETLGSIARRYDVEPADLFAVNGLSGTPQIWAGQVLTLPLRRDGSAPLALDDPQPPDRAGSAPAEAITENTPSGLVHVVQPGENLSDLAKRYDVPVFDISEVNQLAARELLQPGQRLNIPLDLAGSPGYQGKRWVEIDLSDQTLTAWDGDDIYLHTRISSGTARTPTPVGHYRVWHMNEEQTMNGPGYSLPNVKFNMYFYQSYAMHGTWWHNNFGQPMSHGCVNMSEAEAEKLYRFASLGLEVWVHH